MLSPEFSTFHRWVLLAAIVAVVLTWPDAAWTAGQKQVLVLYSTRRDAQIAVVGDRQIPRIIEAGLTSGLDYYSEHLDQDRFLDSQYERAFGDFLRLKYGSHRFDVVIATSDLSLRFLERNRDELFPGVPIVFFVTDPDARPVANATGIKVPLDLARTISLALDLQPDTQNVFVVVGADSTDGGYETAARAQLRSFEDRLTIAYLSGLPTDELEGRLATLPPRSIILYLVVSRDRAGANFHPLDYIDRIAAVANAPTYCWVDSAMGRGIVGGSLKDQQLEVNALATLALRVLRGEPADSITVEQVDLSVSQVDWRQLRRWHISPARIPAGTRILFREPSLWDRYRMYILGAIVLLLAQTALIAGLLIQRARRRQAEERVRNLGGRLLSAQEAERSRIARELHDDVGQQVTLLAIDLELLSRIRKPPEESARIAREALDRVQSVAKSLHDLSHRLHPAKLQLMGLVAAIEGLCRDPSQANVDITFSHHDVPGSLPDDIMLCLFRIVQEALGNAVRHSGAREVSVKLTGNADRVALTIADDGVGFDVDTAWGHGLGLISIAERLEAVGGRLKICSAPGAGTRIDVSVPFGSASVQTIAS